MKWNALVPASLAALALLACAPTRPPVAPKPAPEAKKDEIQNDQKGFIAHEFFLRARQQEMEGNDAVALSYYQIAYEYDPASRDLCFLLTDKLKAAGKMDSALVTGLKCLELKGTPDSHEYQAVAEIHLRKGDIQKALVYYNKALDLDDQDKDLLYTLSTLYESLKDLPKQTEVMEKLLPKIDYPVRLVEKQGQNYRMLGKVDSVAALYKTAWDKTSNALFGEKLASFYEDQEMYASLLDVLRKLATDNPDNLHYELQKARALILAGQPDSAIAAYQGLLKKSPEEREFLSPYGTLLFEKGRFLESRDIFQKLLKSQPENPIYHFFLGSIGMELHDRKMAENELKKAIDLDNKVPEYWAKLASFYIGENQEKKAVDLLEKMGDGKDWYGFYIQGIVFTQVGRKLEEDLKIASEAKTGRAPALAAANAGGASSGKGNPAVKAPRDTGVTSIPAVSADSAAAKGAAAAARGTGPGDSAAAAKSEKAPRDTAVTVAQDTAALSPDLKRARHYREIGVENYRKALELESNNRRVLFELGVALEQLDKRGEAIETMKRLVKLDSSDATILNYLGYMLVEENRELDYAGALIDRALQFEPENGAFLDSKGWLYFQKKDFQNAKKFLDKAMEKIPQDTTILEHYALILEKLGQTQAAQEKWRLILKLDPDHALAHRKLN